MEKSLIFCLSLIFLGFSCGQVSKNGDFKKMSNEVIVEKYLKRCAWTFNMHSREWQICIDSALTLNDKIPYLYQQKSMPYFKSGDYYEGMINLNKAVKFSTDEYTAYRGFMKLIFLRDYDGAINDFKTAKELHPNAYVMDHDFDFYLGLSYLMKKEFYVSESFF